MTDNGAAMQAEEFRAGLHTLGYLPARDYPLLHSYQTLAQETSGPP